MLSQNLPPSKHTERNQQLVTIRDEIRAHGESVATCGKQILLCPHVATSGQWNEIARIAITEKWSFSFFPNGDVRFANL